jgi:hypothetical protein
MRLRSLPQGKSIILSLTTSNYYNHHTIFTDLDFLPEAQNVPCELRTEFINII